MEDTRADIQNSSTESKKSTEWEDDGPHSYTIAHISCGDNSQTRTLIKYEKEEALEIKEEIIQDPESQQSEEHNLFPDKNQLDKKFISSDNNSGNKTLIECNNDETLEIKEEIIQDPERQLSRDYNPFPGKNQLNENFISSDNDSGARTLIEYDNDKTLEIKKEFIQDPERQQSGHHNLLPDKNQLDEKSISSSNNSGNKTLTEYDNDATLEIKEEIIQDHERHQSADNNLSDKNQLEERYIFYDNNSGCRTVIDYDNDEALKIKEEVVEERDNTGQTYNEKHEFKLCTEDTRADYIFATKNHECTPKKLKLQESEQDKKKNSKTPQPRCNSYKTNAKSNLSRHISSRHFKKSQTSQARYKCNKCSLTYSSLKSLNNHTHLKHAAIKVQFICDFCDHKTDVKSSLSKHISVRHFKKSVSSQAKHTCNNCSRTYSSISGLYKHNIFNHAAVLPQFICDVCDYKTNMKSNLSRHISSLHFKKPQTSQARYNCNKCSLSYNSLKVLNNHTHLKHAAIKPQFICDICEHKANLKSDLSRHISSRHFKELQIPQARHNCSKCPRSYSSLYALNRHDRLKHPK